MSETSFAKKTVGTGLSHPSVTPPSVDEGKLVPKPRLGDAGTRRKSIPAGLWTKCPRKSCGQMIFDKELEKNLKVCPHCQYHFPFSAQERIHNLLEEGTFEEMDGDMTSVDMLEFVAVESYKDKLLKSRQRTGMKDAVVTGLARMGAQRVAIGVMSFGFLGGSMGSVVGEKLTRMIEAGTRENLPVVIVSTSGGARMYEGMFSLMQMAKTSAALAYHAQKQLPYISVLTHPTTAGVMASYASLGDLILAEPGAMIGFAGPRVIKDTTQSELPEGFQTAEFLLDHGLIDAIVPRHKLKDHLTTCLAYLSSGRK